MWGRALLFVGVAWLADVVGGSPRIYVVTHHRAGTNAARIFAFPWCRLPTAYGAVPSTRNDCSSKGIELKIDGISDPREIEDNSFVVHFVRNPIDMIVSGYLYHRACQERRWTDTWNPDRKSAKYPSYLPDNDLTKPFGMALRQEYNGSYCRFLQAVPPEIGIQAETIRTLYADGGVGSMMNNSEIFADPKKNLTVINACMSDLNPLTNDRYSLSYRDIYGRLPGIDLDATMDKFNEYRLIVDMEKHSYRVGGGEERNFITRCFWEIASAEYARQSSTISRMRNHATGCPSEFCDRQHPSLMVATPHASCRRDASSPSSSCRRRREQRRRRQ